MKNFTSKRRHAGRTAVAALTTAAILTLVGCGGDTKKADTPAKEDKAAIVTLLTVTSGAGAAYGQAIKEGAELAVEQINADANAVHIKLIVEDTKGDKNEAMNAMNKAIHKDNAVAVLGPMLSGETFAAGPIANQAKIAVLSTTASAEGITDIGEYIFRNAVPESLAVGSAIRQAHAKLGFKTAAIIYSNNNDQLVSVNKTAEKELAALGVKIVSSNTFADKDTDFSAQVHNVAAANPDVVIVAAHYQEGALIMKKLREAGLNQKVIGSNGFNSPVYISTTGPAADGSIVGTPWFPNRDSQIVRDFKAAYKAKYGKDPDQFAAQAYDGVYLVEAALKKSGSLTDREAYKNALKSITDIVGVTGAFKFDDNRNPSMEVQVLEVRGGKFEAL